jgi:anti-anti-sigma factor
MPFASLVGGLGGLEVREDGRGGVLVALSGEFDRGNLSGLREALEAAAALGRPAVVDLSGVTFLDLGAARELAVCHQMHGDRVSLSNPSPEVLSSIASCGLGGWISFASHQPPQAPTAHP